MKKKDVRISPYILIPGIFSGIAFLAVIIAYRVILSGREDGVDSEQTIIWFSIATIVITFVFSYLIIAIILKPIDRFVAAAENIPAVAAQKVTADKPPSGLPDDMEHIHEVLGQVTTILDKVRSRELFPDFIGASKVIRAIFGQIMKVAPTDTGVLILGNSGTGKELVANSIYERSLRKDQPFVKINCVAIPEGLLESELFGHEKGAFTGAVARKIGKFEIANGGTIFLDEIGDMQPATQAKLLRVLQEKEFERVGGTQPIRVDIRFIAATNKNLPDMIKTGQFREDLYYRLNVFTIVLPPLRDRLEDIPFLIDHFLKAAGKDLTVSPRAMQLMMAYDWPGNIRELQNIILRASVIAEDVIEPGNLPPELHGKSGMSGISLHSGVTDDGKPLDERLAGIEKGMIIEALIRAGGVQVRAAELLNINQRSLWHRIKKHGIDVTSLKNLQNM
jgi:transcriptional regulator with PAS, ATPase and Fis domain